MTRSGRLFVFDGFGLILALVCHLVSGEKFQPPGDDKLYSIIFSFPVCSGSATKAEKYLMFWLY